MCTDRTLRDKIRKFNEAAEAVKAAEALKAKLSAEIIAELDTRSTNKFETIQIITRAQDRADTKALKENYPEIWEQVKKRSVSRYLGKAKQA